MHERISQTRIMPHQPFKVWGIKMWLPQKVQMSQLMRLWYLSHRRPAKAQRSCAFAQSRQSLRCSHTWSIEVDEGSDQKSDTSPHWMAAHAHLKNEITEDEKCHNLMRWLRCSIVVLTSRHLMLSPALFLVLVLVSVLFSIVNRTHRYWPVDPVTRSYPVVRPVWYEPRHEKTCLPGLRPVKTQTGLRSYRDKLEAWDFTYRNYRYYTSPVKRICVFEHSVMTSFNCACPAIQRGQGSGFLSEGSSWLTACMSEQRRFWRDCADAQARLNLRCSHRR